VNPTPYRRMGEVHIQWMDNTEYGSKADCVWKRPIHSCESIRMTCGSCSLAWIAPTIHWQFAFRWRAVPMVRTSRALCGNTRGIRSCSDCFVLTSNRQNAEAIALARRCSLESPHEVGRADFDVSTKTSQKRTNLPCRVFRRLCKCLSAPKQEQLHAGFRGDDKEAELVPPGILDHGPGGVDGQRDWIPSREASPTGGGIAPRRVPWPTGPEPRRSRRFRPPECCRIRSGIDPEALFSFPWSAPLVDIPGSNGKTGAILEEAIMRGNSQFGAGTGLDHPITVLGWSCCATSYPIRHPIPGRR
jgi:hypothetical protein